MIIGGVSGTGGVSGVGEEGGGDGGGEGGFAEYRYGTISAAFTIIFSPRSNIIHGASDDALMQRVSANSSVQILITVGFRSAVMYLCVSITV